MQGAREYYDLFETGQYGKLWIQTGYHARGNTFRIYVLPEGVVDANKYPLSMIKDAVEVYGVVFGNPGWTESYGWLHEGPWVDDFNKLVGEKMEAKYRKETKIKEESKFNKKEEQERIKKLLDQY